MSNTTQKQIGTFKRPKSTIALSHNLAIDIFKDFFQNSLNSKGNIMSSRVLDDRKYSSSSAPFCCYSWNIRHHIDPHFPRYETWKCSSQIHFAQWFIPLTKYWSGSSPYLISLREKGRWAGSSSLAQHVGLTTQFLRQECNLAVSIDRFRSPLPVDARHGEQNGRSQIL